MGKSNKYVHFDDMCWPSNTPEARETEWHLRYGNLEEHRFVAASIVQAYFALINKPQSVRNRIISQIRHESLKLTTPDVLQPSQSTETNK